MDIACFREKASRQHIVTAGLNQHGWLVGEMKSVSSTFVPITGILFYMMDVIVWAEKMGHMIVTYGL